VRNRRQYIAENNRHALAVFAIDKSGLLCYHQAMKKTILALSLGTAIALSACGKDSQLVGNAPTDEYKKELERTHEHYAKLGKINHSKDECVADGVRYWKEAVAGSEMPTALNTTAERRAIIYTQGVLRSENRHATEATLNNR